MAPCVAEGLERVARGFQSADGPVWLPEGCLMFNDTAANTTYKLTPHGRVTRYDWTFDAECEPRAQFCFTGITRDLQGRLVICEPSNACVITTGR